MSPYPNAYQIEEMFFNRLNPNLFHDHLADPIDVTVSGTDFHISGNYKTVEEFHDNIYGRINDAVKKETLRVDVRRVIGGGDSAVGREYQLEMVDLVRFDSKGKIVQMKEFLDSVAIHNLVDAHEKKVKEGS
ncbi:MAG: hypothetical protein Q9167_005262 [Letrouitia subvulpina]